MAPRMLRVQASQFVCCLVPTPPSDPSRRNLFHLEVVVVFLLLEVNKDRDYIRIRCIRSVDSELEAALPESGSRQEWLGR